MEAIRDQQADCATGGVRYARHRPEETLLYRVVDDHYPDFLAQIEAEWRTLPWFVRREFEDYLKCGRLEHGFLRVRCTECHAEKLVAFSCKRRGFGPSCGARRMVESAALLVDEVLPAVPMRQWVLSVPYALLVREQCRRHGRGIADRVPHDQWIPDPQSRPGSPEPRGKAGRSPWCSASAAR